MKNKEIKEIFSKLRNRYIWKFLELITIIVIAAFIPIQDFGLAFFLMSVMYFASSFFTPSFMSDESDKVKKYYNTLSLVSPLIGFGLAAILYAVSLLSPYEKPMRLITTILMFRFFSMAPETFYASRNNYDKIYRINISSQIVMSLIAFSLIYLNLGYEAVLYGYLGMEILRSMNLWARFPFKIKPKFDKEMFSLMMTNIKLNFPASFITSLYYYGILIYSAFILGMIEFAYIYLGFYIGFFIYENVTIFLNSILVNKLRDMKEELFRYSLIRLFEYYSFISVLITSLIVVLGKEMLHFLSVYWEEGAIVIMLISVAGMIKSISETARIAFILNSKTEVLQRIRAVEVFILFLFSFMMSFTTGIAISVLISAMISSSLYLAISSRIIKIDMLSISKEYIYTIFSGLLTVLVIGFLKEVVYIGNILALLFFIILSIICFFGLTFLFNKDIYKRIIRFIFSLAEEK